MQQPTMPIQPGSRLLAVTRWCAIVVGIAQLLLAGIAVSFLVESYRSSPTPSPFYWCFAIGFLFVQVAVLYLGWNVQRKGTPNLRFLALAYIAGHVMMAIFSLVGRFGNLAAVLYGRNAVLPPNEIFGSDWAVVAPILVFQLAQWLNIVPLILVVLALVGTKKAQRGTTE